MQPVSAILFWWFDDSASICYPCVRAALLFHNGNPITARTIQEPAN